MTDKLLEAAARVDVIETAARIIANPRRMATAASVADVLALACAVEKFWAVCLEAETLVELLTVEGSEPVGDLHRPEVDAITEMMAALRGQTNTRTNDQETSHEQ